MSRPTPLRNNSVSGPHQSSTHGGQFANKIQDAPAAGIPARFRLNHGSEPVTLSQSLDLPDWPRGLPYPETSVGRHPYSGEVITEMRVGEGSWMRINTEEYELDSQVPEVYDGNDYGFNVDDEKLLDQVQEWGAMAQKRAAALALICEDEIKPSIELPAWDGPGEQPAVSMGFAEHSGSKPVVDLRFEGAEHPFELSYDQSEEEVTIQDEFYEGDYGLDTDDDEAVTKLESWGREVHLRYRNALEDNPEHMQAIGAFAAGNS